MVHKGLDLVLEAFAATPELQLTVCGPVDRERNFNDFYRRELYRTPNIRTVGWIDVAGREFRPNRRTRASALRLSLVFRRMRRLRGDEPSRRTHADRQS